MNISQNPAKTISKQINVFTRRHPFVISSTESFTTSQRRAFLRDVYDYSRSLDLNKKEAKQQTIKAREICGEDEYDTDETCLENEIDDSKTILANLSEAARTNSQDSGHIGSGTDPIPSGQSKIASSSKQPLINLQKRKRQTTDSKLSSKTTQLLNSIPTQTTTRTFVDQTSKDRQTNRSKTRSPIEQGTVADGPKSFTSTGHSSRGIKPGTQETTGSESPGSRSFAGQTGSLIATNRQASTDSAIVLKPQRLIKRSHHFALPEVVSFSDDDEDSLVMRKQRSTESRSNPK